MPLREVYTGTAIIKKGFYCSILTFKAAFYEMHLTEIYNFLRIIKKVCGT